MDRMIFQRRWRPLSVRVMPRHNCGTMVESSSGGSQYRPLLSSVSIVLPRWMDISLGPSVAPLFRDRPQLGRSREYERSFPFFFSKFSDAWGYVLHIYGFMAVWYVSWPRVLF